MRITINMAQWLPRHPKLTRVLWFAGLWCAGVAAISALALLFRVLLLASFPT